jgi:ligand-binding sensor domain-containing protein
MKMHSIRQSICCILILFASSAICIAQTETRSTLVGQKIGVPTLIKSEGSDVTDNVHCALMDKAGILWFGTTYDGVYCYDGHLFTHYTMHDGLSSNTIWCIYEDRNGNIWLGTSNGLTQYDGKQFTTLPVLATNTKRWAFSNAEQSGTVKNGVWSIMQDKAGQFWIGTDDAVYCYDGKSFTNFLDKDSIINKGNLKLNSIQSIVEDKQGNMWFASAAAEGICRFDGKSLQRLTPFDYGRILSAMADKKGNIWFGTAYGAICYDGTSFVNVTKNAGFIAWVYSIIQDSKGNMWFVTENAIGPEYEVGGAYCYNGKSFTRFTTTEGLVHKGVFCAVEDKVGNIWFGTRNTSLCRYD